MDELPQTQPVSQVPLSPPQTPLQPTAPAMPVQPPAPQGPDKNVLVFIVLAVIAAVLLLIFILSLSKGKTTSNASGTSAKINVGLGPQMPDYSTDTDNDGYPDFVETQNGYDPKVSAYDACKKNDCADAQLQQSQTKHNVLIILDDSGSMQLGGTPNRMEIAKQAIKSYVSKASSNTSIGLMIYGHKGSNSDSDKAASCASAETISQIGSVTSGSIDGLLSPIKPVGWTPMGLALKQATANFVGKEGQNNEVILLTDGEETCNTNPTGEAAALKGSAQNVKINVIGFAVDANAQSQLNQISTSGGGSFSVANNLTELDQKFSDLYENGLKLLSAAKCQGASLDAFRTCYREPYQKIYDWISKRKISYFDKKISKAEYDALDNLASKTFKQYNDVTTKETQNTTDYYKKSIQQMRGD